MEYKGVDFYLLDNLFTEEEKAIRDTVRDFVNEQILPIIEKYNQEMKFPMHIVPQMAELGLFGPTIPAEYGGLGLNYTTYGLIMQELERGDSGIRSFASVQSSLVMYPIYTFGSEEQKKHWLPKLAAAEKIGCFGLTEPDFGSNPSGMITKAEKVEGGYVLNGAKMWITNGTIADVAVVWAKLDGKVKGFLVEKGTKGFYAPETKGKLSLRASVTSELVFEDCLIPEENILPNSSGLKSPLMCLTQARYGIAWGVTGLAMECYNTALNYSLSRIQFGKSIASFQINQQKLAVMLTEITKAQLLNYRLGKLIDEKKMRPQHVSMAKRNNCEIAKNIASTAREMLGANGILDEYPIMRHLNNIESVKTYEGTHEMHTLILGQDITGISAFE
ncbi:MAG: acyl-CoA dehydrogenase family protein [Ignavibacteria bacterium]|nr:acyl-CoA dehydrogenase family protein [Ignavibacteria bacterium]